MKALSCLILLLVTVMLPCSAKNPSGGEDNPVREDNRWCPMEMPANYAEGGSKGLLRDLYTQLYHTAPASQECVSGRAIVEFYVTKEGDIDANSIKLIRNKSVPQDYLDAAIEAIKHLGKFEPAARFDSAEQKWETLRVKFILPVIYPIPDHVDLSAVRDGGQVQ